MTGTTLSSDGLDLRRRKLKYRCWHRGTREMDLILGRFADSRVAELDSPALAELERLMDVPDPLLFAWIIGASPPEAGFDTTLMRQLRAFHMASVREP